MSAHVPLFRSALLCGLLFASQVAAQATKVSVSVSHAGDDAVGRRLAFELKEVIRSSAGYQLEVNSPGLFRINLVTLDPGSKRFDDENLQTVCSVVLTMRNHNPFKPDDPQTWYPIFLTNGVRIVGNKAVQDVARDILASLDEAIEEFRADTHRR